MVARRRFAARQDIRYVGAISGRYSLAASEAGKAEVYACRALSLSTSTLVLTVPVLGALGSQIAVVLEHIGLIKGTVIQGAKSALHISIAASGTERETLAAKINWLKKYRVKLADNMRDAQRWRPKNPKAVFYLEDETPNVCFVVDVSASGAAISAKVVPAVGTALVVGELPAVVVRHTETGFGVQFQSVQDEKSVEAKVAAQPIGAAPARA